MDSKPTNIMFEKKRTQKPPGYILKTKKRNLEKMY
jgi:hypothetical protein